jgi:hypothetical protein
MFRYEGERIVCVNCSDLPNSPVREHLHVLRTGFEPTFSRHGAIPAAQLAEAFCLG